MKLKILSSLCILLTHLSAVGEAGAIFLLISPGAGPQGTGEAQVAKVNDAYASYYNPAGFGFLKGREAVGMHVQWLPNLADDLFYEFIAYRHYIDGLGSVGGHIIFLNLGEQIGTDEQGNYTSNWSSFMTAVSGSFGTQLTPSSSIGFNFKVFHQKLAEATTADEGGDPYSTDFGFDVGYLKKFKQSSQARKKRIKKKIDRFFNQFSEFYDQQSYINEKIFGLLKNESNIYHIVESQEVLLDEIEMQKENAALIFPELVSQGTNLELDEHIISIISQIEALIDSLNEFNRKEAIDPPLEPEPIENILDLAEKISIKIMAIELLKDNLLTEINETEIKEDTDDTFNLGFCISNIGPKIDFVDAAQADPSPMNMRMGLFAQLYNDGNNKLNFLFDANKLLVTRYEMMDWDGDRRVGGYDKSGNWLGIEDESAIYNTNGKKEYDAKGYFDDPWYLAIFTAWLDDWYLGGDIDFDGDRYIGGWTWDETMDDDGEPDVDELENDVDGIYGKCINGEACVEKGSADHRSFINELEKMIYNVGLEYWYTDNFALRVGYIYDDEGKVINPTFGAGIRLLQYGFDFGYTAGDPGHPRANTMFFSINMKL